MSDKLILLVQSYNIYKDMIKDLQPTGNKIKDISRNLKRNKAKEQRLLYKDKIIKESELVIDRCSGVLIDFIKKRKNIRRNLCLYQYNYAIRVLCSVKSGEKVNVKSPKRKF